MQFSPEFKLVLDCCQWNFIGAGAHPVQLPPSVDWPSVARLVHFHRIGGLVFEALQASGGVVPPVVLDQMREVARATAMANLRAIAQSKSLLATLDGVGVRALFLKGQAIGALAYVNPAMKSAIDIDVLVDPDHLGTAASALLKMGYQPVLPDGETPEQLYAWHLRTKESVWQRGAQQSLQLDLHTRVSDNQRLIPGISVHSPSQRVVVPGHAELPTLATEELFAYLAVHGSSSAWFRLKWIADFAGFLSGRGPGEIEQLFRRSRQLGAGRAPGQALLLADALFGTLRGLAVLRLELENDFCTRLLFKAALRELSREPREPTHTRFGTVTIHWTQLLLMPGVTFKLSEIRRQFRHAIARRVHALGSAPQLNR